MNLSDPFGTSCQDLMIGGSNYGFKDVPNGTTIIDPYGNTTVFGNSGNTGAIYGNTSILDTPDSRTPDQIVQQMAQTAPDMANAMQAAINNLAPNIGDSLRYTDPFAGIGNLTSVTGANGFTMTVTQPASVNNDNELRYKVAFNVSGQQNGYIIQHAWTTVSIFDANGGFKNVVQPVPFYERWKVKDGTIFDEADPAGANSLTRNIDSFGFSLDMIRDNERAVIVMSGEVAFLPDYTPQSSDGWGIIQEAHGMMATTRQPDGWPSSGGTTSHIMIVIIDKTTNPPTITTMTYP